MAFLLFFGLPTSGNEATLDQYLITLSPQQYQKLTTPLDIEYNWSTKDIQDSALMVQTECGHLGEDCYLSVLSTMYGRWQNERWCWKCENIGDVIYRPGQFVGPAVAKEMYGEDVYDIIRPESYLATYKFILGFRGSCSNGHQGFEYFNSYPGGLVACKIEHESGSYVEFFSSESFESTRYNSADKARFYNSLGLNSSSGNNWSSCGGDKRYSYEHC